MRGKPDRKRKKRICSFIEKVRDMQKTMYYLTQFVFLSISVGALPAMVRARVGA